MMEQRGPRDGRGRGGERRGQGMDSGRGHGRGHGRGRGGEMSGEPRAKTFRRKRALSFLEMLYVKQDVLKSQLKQGEFVESRGIIEGELKAVNQIIEEFKVVFQVEQSELEEQTTEEVAKSPVNKEQE